MTMHWFANFKKSIQDITNKLNQRGHFIFALLGENSFLEWKEILTACNYAIPTPAFPTEKEIKESIPELKIRTEMLTHSYNHLHEFLSSLKKLGAIASRPNYLPLPAGKLRKILRNYRYSIDITFEVIYGEYIKP
jgi:hypothetical protein